MDPLAGLDLGPLEALFDDASIVKVLHASSQDLEIFYLRTGKPPRNVFDTQLAAAMLGMGAQISLGGLVSALTGVHLTKGASFTDWLARPLSPEQERYAVDDVRYLLPMHDRLLEKLDELGRSGWMREESAKFEKPELYDAPPAELYRKVKRHGSLDSRGLAVLRELAAWRDVEAQRRDRNRRAVIADEIMVEIARSLPRNIKALSRTRGLHNQVVDNAGEAILNAVQTGLDVPEAQRPSLRKRQAPEPGVELTSAIVVAFLKAHCAMTGIDPSMIANTAEIESLVSAYSSGELSPDSVPMLQGWRGELVGNRVLAFLRGSVSVRMDPQTAAPVFEDLPSLDG